LANDIKRSRKFKLFGAFYHFHQTNGGAVNSVVCKLLIVRWLFSFKMKLLVNKDKWSAALLRQLLLAKAKISWKPAPNLELEAR